MVSPSEPEQKHGRLYLSVPYNGTCLPSESTQRDTVGHTISNTPSLFSPEHTRTFPKPGDWPARKHEGHPSANGLYVCTLNSRTSCCTWSPPRRHAVGMPLLHRGNCRCHLPPGPRSLGESPVYSCSASDKLQDLRRTHPKNAANNPNFLNSRTTLQANCQNHMLCILIWESIALYFRLENNST